MNEDDVSEEELIDAILSANPDLSRSKLESIINQYMQEYDVKRKTALFLILLEYQSEPVHRESSHLSLSELMSGLSNVTIVARIAWLGLTKRIKNGFMTRGGILDSSRVMPIVFWGRTREDLLNMGVNKDSIVEIKGCHVRENLSGELEVHVTERSSIRLAYEYDEKVPYIDEKFKSIAEASSDPSLYQFLYGILLTKPVEKDVSLDGGGVRKLYQIYVGDGNVAVRCVSWGGVPDDLLNTPILEPIRMYYVRVITNRFGEREVRMNSYSFIESDYSVDAKLNVNTSNLSGVSNGFNVLKVRLKILSKGVSRVKDSSRTLSLLVHDGETEAILTALNDKVTVFNSLKDGDEIMLELFRAIVRPFQTPSISLFTVDSTNVRRLDDHNISHELPFVTANKIFQGFAYVNIAGKVVSLEESDDEMEMGRLLLLIDDLDTPIQIKFRGNILNYSSFIPRKGERILVRAAQVDYPHVKDPSSPLFMVPSLRLRAFSRIVEY